MQWSPNFPVLTILALFLKVRIVPIKGENSIHTHDINPSHFMFGRGKKENKLKEFFWLNRLFEKLRTKWIKL